MVNYVKTQVKPVFFKSLLQQFGVIPKIQAARTGGARGAGGAMATTIFLEIKNLLQLILKSI